MRNIFENTPMWKQKQLQMLEHAFWFLNMHLRTLGESFNESGKTHFRWKVFVDICSLLFGFQSCWSK